MQKLETPHEDLADIVLNWPIEYVLNKDLYRNKVKDIPNTFQSLQHYSQSFMAPLLEETRSEMCSGMEQLSRAPTLKILHSKRHNEEEDEYLDIIATLLRSSTSAPIDDDDEGGTGSSKEPYVPEVDDVFVLTERILPSTSFATDHLVMIGELGRSYNVAVVTCMMNDQIGPDYLIRVKASKPIELPRPAADGKRSTTQLLAVMAMNIKTNSRIWSSLHWINAFMKNSRIIGDVLDLDTNSVEERCDFCNGQNTHIEGVNVENKLLSFELNDSQKDAVLACLSARQCIGKHSVRLIWGPPGTGKTKTASVLLWTLLKLKCRTLTCAPTNVAVLKVASCLVSLVTESVSTGDCSLGSILLFGNKKRMKINGDLKDVFLDNRVAGLSRCFAPRSGWSDQLKSMIEFLEYCVPKYKSYKEEEDDDSLMFRKFVQLVFNPMAEELMQCMKILFTHLPASSTSRIKFDVMTEVCDLLQTFKSLLCKVDIVDIELERIFVHSEELVNYATSQPEGRANNDSTALRLGKIRSDLLGLLRSLQGSVQMPELDEGSSIQEFCFNKASIILCTASTSFRLHSMRMKLLPLEMLVIDEAAQLKECEATIPLQLSAIRRAILIGDECQLSAMVKSEVAKEVGFGRSIFERLTSLGLRRHFLNMQYRMHPSISSFPNATFYGNKILDAPNVKDPRYGRHYLPGRMYGSYSFINVTKGKEVCDRRSPKNMVEVAVVLQLVKSLSEASLSLKQKISVGVVCPYSAQVSEIQEKLGKKYEKKGDVLVSIKSIDGFQGGEEDVIIISTVRSNMKGGVGFLSNLQRTNVALTRARHCLWIVGNAYTLSFSNHVWKKVVLDAKTRGCFFNAEEDNDLAEAIICAVIEFDQCVDLLDANSPIFNKARWKVEFTADFKSSFAKVMGVHIQKEVIEFLKKLSNGWHPWNEDVVKGCSFQLLRQYDVKGQYLIWAVDILEEKSNYIQVLKVWDIVPFEEISKPVIRSNAMFGSYTEDHISKCRFRRPEGNLVVPMSWKITPEAASPSNHDKAIEDLSSHLNSINLGIDSGIDSHASTSQLNEVMGGDAIRTEEISVSQREGRQQKLSSLCSGQIASSSSSTPYPNDVGFSCMNSSKIVGGFAFCFFLLAKGIYKLIVKK